MDKVLTKVAAGIVSAVKTGLRAKPKALDAIVRKVRRRARVAEVLRTGTIMADEAILFLTAACAAALREDPALGKVLIKRLPEIAELAAANTAWRDSHVDRRVMLDIAAACKRNMAAANSAASAIGIDAAALLKALDVLAVHAPDAPSTARSESRGSANDAGIALLEESKFAELARKHLIGAASTETDESEIDVFAALSE